MKYLNNGVESDHAPIKKLVVGTELSVSKYESEPGPSFRGSSLFGYRIKVSLISGYVVMNVKLLCRRDPPS